MREFVSAGGELIIHGALHLTNSPIPELAKQPFNETKDETQKDYPAVRIRSRIRRFKKGTP
jgi:hypothetical protein